MPQMLSGSSFGRWEDESLPKIPKCVGQLRQGIVSFSYRYTAAWHKMNGYHFGVMCCAWTSAAVLVINIIVTIWGAAKFEVQGGLGMIQDGDCTTTKNVGFWLHLTINVLSTLLLGASNYSMQCLSSPTRIEIDRAHRRNLWLDIGVPSIRNLRRISASRIAVWWILAASSIPLHLFYNSAVFSSLYGREYNVWVVSNDFPAAGLNSSDLGWNNITEQKYQQLRGTASTLQRLENRACLEAYLGPINSNRGDVLLISSYNSTDVMSPSQDGQNTFFSVASGFNHGTGAQTSSQWICNIQTDSYDNGASCDLKKSASTATSWVFEEWNVQFCLSQLEEEHCKLQFSAAIMIFVICCNFTKLICMIWIARKRDAEPLVTLSDAIASFLDEPDPTTRDACLAGRKDFEDNEPSNWSAGLKGLLRFRLRRVPPSKLKGSWGMLPMEWAPKRHFWFTTASVSRWIFCNTLCLSTLIIVSVLLASGIGNGYLSNTSLSYLWSLGFGTVTAESIIPPTWQTSGSWGLLLTVLISNSPQLVLSFLYLTYNSLFTCMLLAAEWRGYAHERKALRVSSASGKQRSTYWLQLPYRYSIPLLVASGTLHWLVSQSIFLARVTVLDSSGVEDPAESLSTCGYSNIAIFFVIALGVPVVLIGIAHGFRRYDGGMPLAGSCSTAINAACHPPKDDVHASGKKVMWGVVDGCIPSDGGIAIGHCSFSSFEVSAPVEGQIYAGSRGRHELGCRASQAQIINDNGHVAISESLSVQLVTHPATTHTHQVRE